VKYVAHGNAQGQRYLAMEWIAGEDVASRMKRTGLRPDESIQLIASVADGLAAIHAHGIVHRDIKPSNLFLPDGDIERIKILDFGVARPLEDVGLLTSAGDTIGTPNYMAPEQARGEVDIDERADIFALGCVLFECLSGRPPFSAPSGVGVLAKILFEDPPRISDLASGLEPVDDILAKMMAKDRKDRPAHAADVAAALRALPSLSGPATLLVAGAGRDALTTAERRLVCVVVAAPIGVTVDGPVLDFDPGQTVAPEILRLGAQHQARIETLRNRSVVALMSSVGSATDLAARAALCALAMRARLGDDNAIALATGRAVMSSLKMPVGDVIDRAARMLEGGGGVAIDEITAGLLDARFRVEEVGGRLRLTGEREPTETTRRLLGKPTPCVGRERELSLLAGVWGECIEEPGARAVVLVGPAGIGKSRLRFELLRRQRERSGPFELWMARGDSDGRRLALRPHLAGAAPRLPHPRRRGARGPRRQGQGARRAPPAGRGSGPRRRVPRRAHRRPLPRAGQRAAAPGAPRSRRHGRSDPPRLGGLRARRGRRGAGGHRARGPPLGRSADGQPVRRGAPPLRRPALFVLAMARPEVDDLFPELWREHGAHVVRVNAAVAQGGREAGAGRPPGATGDEAIARLVEQAAGNAFYLRS
jgi:hypothetical protein